MCIAIYKPANKDINRETLETCFKANSHGCGFAYISQSHTGHRKIKIKKTLDFETFYRQYQRAIEVEPESPFLIHFRIKTHGPINKDNCHPFSVDNDTVFIHNGIIQGVGTDKEKSDTRLFNEKVLKDLPEGWMFSEGTRTLIEGFIGYSKLAVMDINGNVELFNEAKGNWNDGIWYSNVSWKPKVETKVYNNTAVYIPCDGCGKYNSRYMMEYYYTLGEFNSFCKECANRRKEWDIVFPSDYISRNTYEAWSNISPTNSETLLYNDIN